jgi:hypothetical protein
MVKYQKNQSHMVWWNKGVPQQDWDLDYLAHYRLIVRHRAGLHKKSN